MVKEKISYQCSSCGTQTVKWAGKCPECASWNTMLEVVAKESFLPIFGENKNKATQVQALSEVEVSNLSRFSISLSELDRVIGGGLVDGSVVLIGGDPGIGKSTILLQALSALGQIPKTSLYISAEESIDQISLRAKRLDTPVTNLFILAENHLETIISKTLEHKPKVLVVDSIQTVYTSHLQSMPGSVGQVRECAAQLVRLAKQTGIAIFLVGHVTKEGQLAGPRVLEHMVDTVLYFEGDSRSPYRIIRAVKNRYGAVNELGIFSMTERGLRGINNPSAIFLSRHTGPVSGSVVMVTLEGTRPLLVEVQALVSDTQLDHPRRVALGLEQNRLVMLLAVLNRHMGIGTARYDVFVNVVGGVRINETAGDLAILLAVISSLNDQPLPDDLVVFGELGLSGEVRPVQSGIERLKDASKHGFRQAIIPYANRPKKEISGMSIQAVRHLSKLQHALKI